ncbi:MAG: sugar transferase [Pseudomonadota bacterium]
MLLWKRIFDFLSALILIPIASPFLLYFSYRMWREEERPIFYIAPRMKSPTETFGLIKFRTMANNSDDGVATGGDKLSRITPLGRYLRSRRLDELPQLFNVLKGDISFVGPRPPLRSYVEAYPELYAEVLKSRPGITGLATLKFRHREGEILSKCTTAKETHETYLRRCIPIKARLDLIYQRNYRPCLDYWIIYETLSETFGRKRKRDP